MKTHYLWICTLIVFCFSGASTAQDFSQLLEAVDKLEASLTEMVNVEKSNRQEANNDLSKQLQTLRAELQALQTQLSEPGVQASSPAHNDCQKQMAKLTGQIIGLKADVHQLAQTQSEDVAVPGPVRINMPNQHQVPPVNFSGFVDASNYSDFNSEETSFGLDQVEVDVIREFEGKALLRADVEYVSDGAGGFGLDLEQGFITYNFDPHWGVTFGKFNAPIGFELLDAPDMYQYSHALVFDNGLPTNLTGFMLNMSQGIVDWNLYAVNGWDVNADNNKDKTFGTRLGISPANGLSMGWSFISGPEQDENNSSRRTVFDYDLTFTALSGWMFGAEYNHGFESKILTNNETGSWNGFLIMANWGLSDRIGMTWRYDFFNDSDGLRTGVEQKLMAVTWSPSLSLVDGLGGLFELRWDKSDGKVFIDSEGVAKDNQVTTAIEFTYGF
ncbi:MAG: porin [candidate division Zixibacteria bacterium]